MRTGEDALQVAAVDFCRVAIKRPDRFWFVPNGGNLSRAQAGKFKAMGLTPGVSDLHFAYAIGGQRQFPMFATLELKWGKNVETDDQKRFGADLVACGHYYAACWTIEQVYANLIAMKIELHARLGPQGIALSGPAIHARRA